MADKKPEDSGQSTTQREKKRNSLIAIGIIAGLVVIGIIIDAGTELL